LNEALLIEQLKQGSTTAFREIIDTHGDRVYNTVLGIVQHETDAEDVTQEVFVQVFESVKGFQAGAAFSTWLYRIAVNKALEHLRRKKRKKRFGIVQALFGSANEPVLELPEFNHPGIRLENKERAAELFSAVARLPDNQRTAFTLHKLEGLSYRTISEVMETSVPAVEALMHRAKQNLVKYLETYYKQQNR
jgi:RNA polymerase sigma-70 factor (ECF subfamily)